MEKEYIKINKELWNTRTTHHIKSDFYNVDAFLKGASSLNDIEIELLGDIKEKTILHLQCHFGQDSLSLQRMGANVTGIDLSDKSVEAAQKYASQLNLDTEFICCDIYDLPSHLDKKFDIVFTSYGVLGWLPDMDKWASVVSQFLKQHGKFVLVEFHPVVWMFDDNFSYVQYDYFNRKPIVEIESGTYADTQAVIEQKSIGWNHSIDEVFSALVDNGLEINQLKEYDYSPYNCLKGMEKVDENKYRIKTMKSKIPLLYSILARKK